MAGRQSTPRRRSGRRPEFYLGTRLIPVDRNAVNVHLHGGHVERAHAGEMLHDAGHAVLVAPLRLAGDREEKRDGKSCGQGGMYHARLRFQSIQIDFAAISTPVFLRNSPAECPRGQGRHNTARVVF